MPYTDPDVVTPEEIRSKACRTFEGAMGASACFEAIPRFWHGDKR